MADSQNPSAPLIPNEAPPAYSPPVSKQPPAGMAQNYSGGYQQGGPPAGYQQGNPPPGYQQGGPPGGYGGPMGYQSGPQPSYITGQNPGGPVIVTHQPAAAQVVVVGGCPACRVGVLEDDFTCLGVCCAVLFFPIGLICCLLMRQRHCRNCGAVFG